MIYVSSDASDVEIAARTSALAAAAGAHVWRPNLADGAVSFVEQRREAIAKAHLAILIASPAYAGSILCRNEARSVAASNVPLLAIATGGEAGLEGARSLGATTVLSMDAPDFTRTFVAYLQDIGAAPPPKASMQRTSAGAANGSSPLFINFATADLAFVEEARAEIEVHGFKVWDYVAGERNLQQSLATEIEQTIDNCLGLISIVTNRWRDSQWVMREYLYAREIGKPTFLLLFEPIRPTLVISERTLIDLTKGRPDGFARLLGELRELA